MLYTQKEWLLAILLVPLLASVDADPAASQEHEVTIRRAHSRRRRFIAPGARWDILVGVEVLGDDTEVRFDVVTRYEFDYLFGGAAALQAAIAAANAAALAAQETEAAVLASAGRRRKRHGEEEEEEEEKSVSTKYVCRLTCVHGILTFRVTEGNGNLFSSLFSGRSLENVLTRTLADDQVDILSVSASLQFCWLIRLSSPPSLFLLILQNVESSLDRSGLPGRQCVLRAACEFAETPINEWSLVGEMLSVLLS